MPKKISWKKGEPLQEKTQERLRALIREMGEGEAAEVIGLNAQSLLRAAGGGGIRRTTAFAIETKLNQLEEKKVSA